MNENFNSFLEISVKKMCDFLPIIFDVIAGMLFPSKFFY